MRKDSIIIWKFLESMVPFPDVWEIKFQINNQVDVHFNLWENVFL
jgi:hypothetical protein